MCLCIILYKFFSLKKVSKVLINDGIISHLDIKVFFYIFTKKVQL